MLAHFDCPLHETMRIFHKRISQKIKKHQPSIDHHIIRRSVDKKTRIITTQQKTTTGACILLPPYSHHMSFSCVDCILLHASLTPLVASSSSIQTTSFAVRLTFDARCCHKNCQSCSAETRYTHIQTLPLHHINQSINQNQSIDQQPCWNAS